MKNGQSFIPNNQKNVLMQKKYMRKKYGIGMNKSNNSE